MVFDKSKTAILGGVWHPGFVRVTERFESSDLASLTDLKPVMSARLCLPQNPCAVYFAAPQWPWHQSAVDSEPQVAE